VPSSPQAIAIATETTGIDRAVQSFAPSATSHDPDAKTDLTEMMQVGSAPDGGPVQRAEQVDSQVDEVAPARDSEDTDRIQILARRRRTGVRLSGRAMWMALCGGMLAAVCALAAVVVWAANDDASVPKLRRARVVSAASAAATEPQPPPADPPLQPGLTPAAKDASAIKRSGTIFLAPATLPVRFAGAAVRKSAGPYQLSVTGDSGTVEVGEGSYKVELDFTRIAGALDVRVRASSPALVWVNGSSRGRSPVAGVKLEDSETVLELKKPGEHSRMLLRLRYREN
jgi:hypothetical protein